jgi:ribonuclease T2
MNNNGRWIVMAQHRSGLAKWACGIALTVLMYLTAASSATARHHNHASGNEAGDFSYYVLSLSWSPAFCLDSPGSTECSGARRYGFIVHGLWPQNERGWPEHCNVHREVPDSVVQSVADLMPARGLVYHEWATHGTCSGLEPVAFFDLVRGAFGRVAIPPQMSNPTQATEQSPAAVTAAMLRANPKLPPQSVVVTCSGQNAPRLREVRVCFDKQLNPRSCSEDALHAVCKAPQLIIPPIR